MIAPSLYAELVGRGVRLSIAPTPTGEQSPALRLRVQAPVGALTSGLKGALERHRAELLEYVFELEERAAVLQFEQGNTPEESERHARACVVGGSAGPDGRLWLFDLAEHHPAVRHMLKTFNAQIVEVHRSEAA